LDQELLIRAMQDPDQSKVGLLEDIAQNILLLTPQPSRKRRAVNVVARAASIDRPGRWLKKLLKTATFLDQITIDEQKESTGDGLGPELPSGSA
jgi:hypothetical protein